ncbi:MAG: 3-dehydroquinate synthase [Rhodospirillaceae bacterium]
MTSSAPPVTQFIVELGDRSYPIDVGAGLLDLAGQRVLECSGAKRVFILTDDNVGPLHLERLTRSLEAAGLSCASLTIPHGEATKCFDQLERVLDEMLALRLERSSVLIALGGGVIGDLAGFAASVYMRGMRFVQIPTTLLAQVDSSVGGKTGINTPRGKNLVGAFHQPVLVLADADVLGALNPREMRAGYAEVVKYGMIDDATFFGFLEEMGPVILSGQGTARDRAVAHCCLSKARIVAQDERESGVRALLNLGHTFGHALEAEAGFGDILLHGEAVGLGMLMAADLSHRMGLCGPDVQERLRAHLHAVGLPVALHGILPALAQDSPETIAARLIGHMAGDKKVEDGKVTFVLLKGIGQAFLTKDVPRDLLEATLVAALAFSPDDQDDATAATA